MTTVLMADAINGDLKNVPSWLPVAFYVTGSVGIQATPANVKAFTGGTLRIDQSPGLGVPFWSDEADVETGAKTNDDAVAWCEARAAVGMESRLYTGVDNYDALKEAVSGISRVFFRLANWDLSQAEAEKELGGDIYAIQWASPTSNPNTLINGTKITLAEGNVDLSVIESSFLVM